MSWEDCGYRPGKINGPDKCPRRCGDCDGEHHFLVDYDYEFPTFACKHCDATAELIEEEDEGEEIE